MSNFIKTIDNNVTLVGSNQNTFIGGKLNVLNTTASTTTAT